MYVANGVHEDAAAASGFSFMYHHFQCCVTLNRVRLIIGSPSLESGRVLSTQFAQQVFSRCITALVCFRVCCGPNYVMDVQV